MALIPRPIKVCLLVLGLGLALVPPAQAATFAAKRGINLDIWTTWPDESRWGDREVLLPFPEWRQHMTDADLASLKAGGLDFVRMPIDPAPLLSEKAAGLRGEMIGSIAESARLINAAGLKAIVDLHLIPAGDNRGIGMAQVMNDPAQFERYVVLVRELGRALAGFDPKLVAFELMNEPVIGCAGAEQDVWATRLLKLFAAARSSATRLTLVLSGSCWGSAEGLAALDPGMIPDKNVIWSFHSYAPFLLTHQGATWAGDFIPHVTGLPYPLDKALRSELDAALDRIRARIRKDAPAARQAGLLAYLDEEVARVDTSGKLLAAMEKPFETVAKWADKHEVAAQNILLGEFGMIRQEYGTDFIMPPASRAAYYRDMIALSEKRGYAWSMWSYGGAFGLLDSFDGKRAEGDVMEMVRSLPRD